MRHRSRTIVFAALALVPSLLAAQAARRGDAVTEDPVTQEQFASAVERNDQKVLNVSVLELVKATNRAYPDLKLTGPVDLANHIRRLSVKPCSDARTGSRPVKLSRVLGKQIDLSGSWKRPFSKGEMCLYNGNEARYEFSLSCGNHVLERISVAAAMPQPQPSGVTRESARQARESVREEREERGQATDDSNNNSDQRTISTSHWYTPTWEKVGGTVIVAALVTWLGHLLDWWDLTPDKGNDTQKTSICIRINDPSSCTP